MDEGEYAKPRSQAIHCPLCCSGNTKHYFSDSHRAYQRCVDCKLVFVPARYWLTLQEEKATYDLHQNDPNDPGYQKFLSRLSTPLLRKLPPNQTGLDFGCGPGPALPGLLKAGRHRLDLYDPFYFNDPAVFQKCYDFICATEVFEHLRDPAHVFAALFGMLRKGGWLGIMTKLVTDQEAFSRWHYTRDLTHICFFSRSTLGFVARLFHAALYFVDKDVILFRKER